ncbi:hypothetical protein SDC9_154984 [bioreactor metagenome]|uniref:Uncharacterized protein n=1 Tax=bioreactor metagenome TaxID=1076179 RepID=A0A645F585_9ZZZZ
MGTGKTHRRFCRRRDKGAMTGTRPIRFLRNGLPRLNVSTDLPLIVIGRIINFAVAADQIAVGRA